MELKLYNIKDDVTGEFLGILPARNDADFKRMAKSLLGQQDQNNILKENFQDKAVYLIGKIDTLTGVIISEASPVMFCRVAEIVEEMVDEYKRNAQRKKDLEGSGSDKDSN